MLHLVQLSVGYILSTFTVALTQDPVVNIPQGRVVGIKTYNSLTPVEIYYGIPYATPPKGRYRFSAPERHAGWRRTLYAHRIPPHCPHLDNGEHFSEDCLFLNIWTSRRSDGKTVPVVVILYSESWTKGGIDLPCQELAAEGVVVVTVMYRLHLLAFFTLRSKAARGNLALLDQYLAFLWVRDNIAAFGGDPTAISILGHSAGANSLLHHITSPRSIGLFQRVIIMSPFNIWNAIDEQRTTNVTDMERVSRIIASSLRCNSEKDMEILQCMRDRPLSALLALYSNNTWDKYIQPMPDVFLPDSEQFLPNSLLEAFSSTATNNLQLDVLLGSNDLEAFNYYDEEYDEFISRGKQYLSEYFTNYIIPKCLRLFSLDKPELLPMLFRAIKWEYWNENSKNNALQSRNALESIARLESSANWSAGITLIASRLSRIVQNLYVYRYSQPGINIRGQNFNFSGAVHGTDLVALLGDALILQVARRPPIEKEKRASKVFRKYIVNFIKYGSPGENSSWRRFMTGEANIFDINDSGNPTCRSATRDVGFWLHYLPRLSKSISSAEKTAQLTGDTDGGRLRGGVFAMSGITLLLLLLLCICIVLLHRQNARRFQVANENHH